MHMIYARFFMKALNDLGLVGFREPFQSFFTNGWIQLGGTKMSKSKGNVIGPDELISMYGADSLRLYTLFMGPADGDMEWADEGVEGMGRFVRRLYRLVNEVAELAAAGGEAPRNELSRKAHETIARVTDDLGRRRSFNIACGSESLCCCQHLFFGFGTTRSADDHWPLVPYLLYSFFCRLFNGMHMNL